jgi:hypothetical protein
LRERQRRDNILFLELMTHDSIFPFACVTHEDVAISPIFVEKITKIIGK